MNFRRDASDLDNELVVPAATCLAPGDVVAAPADLHARSAAQIARHGRDIGTRRWWGQSKPWCLQDVEHAWAGDGDIPVERLVCVGLHLGSKRDRPSDFLY